MSSKRVLLLNPPGTAYGSGALSSSVPLGLLYLVSYLKENGIETFFYDALAEGKDRCRVNKLGGRRYGVSENRIIREIRKIKPDIVGIGAMFTAYIDDVNKLARMIKKSNRKIMVVVGGSHVSVDPEGVMENRSIDVAVFGEGEETMVEISKGIELECIRGIVYRKSKQLVRNEPRKLIENLDDIPAPAWDVLKIRLYPVGGVFNIRKPVFPIVSSRGCPGHCLYCSVNSVWHHRWRGRTAKNVVDEIEMLMNDYGAREIAFQDDSLSVDKQRLNDICDELLRRKIDIKWTTPNGIAHWTLDKPLLRKMKKAGCYRITFGIESGDLELRRWVGKPYSLDQARDLTKYANRLGYWTLATNIIGFPYETRENINCTFDFALNSDVDLAFFFKLGPRPGTTIYEIFKKEGWLMKDRHLLFSEDVACQTKNFKSEEIVKMQRELYQKFLIRRFFTPLVILRMVQKIKSWEDLAFVNRLVFFGLKLIFNLIFTKTGVTSKTLSV